MNDLGPALAWLTCLPTRILPPLLLPSPMLKTTKRSWAPAFAELMFRPFLLLHFLLVVFIISRFFHQHFLPFCLTCTSRHFALHRSWLHVLVLSRRSVFFPFSFMYRCYTAMISQALSRFHSCMSHTSNSLHFVSASASILQLANTLPITTFSSINVPR